ncbi:MAG: DUF262 domain-containing HNH endonuclease family protein [Ewingella americana]|jgi:hypothetical protein|uniref:DUF262 domain-containing protein n=1 Tax=Ewingella americana TaxID=41202 RepID=UPI00242D280D|nr:DUF262 domain-containing HNH endonuclease family protein [Ewingella americana]MCI1680850.1 DUF262 domain-containing HNH endonuclease family protein [Ewingella americana]MCI1855344.1 DUF262 domain-containing HNH endonuclease family protein [Ewingella americana]MCI1862203.1 DUF262 domain-containing HNH endonuclease family protein [Ewingella americana]MCI2143693.1 DUF262 domain-containing HNH endonuclease family protein [Ewingella americana]MCI2162635.1 DUF262 domain-containing HNH endonucleas
MKSEPLTVNQLFQNRRQYCVPFYQRAYVWTLRDQWSALLEDIIDKAESRLSKTKPTPHFLGAIVLEPQSKDSLLGVDTSHIIDGQQRLTTLQYVLASIRLALRATGLSGLEKIVLPCLRNINEETMRNVDVERFKLWPTFRDQKDFIKSLNVDSVEALREVYPENFTQHGTLRKYFSHPPSLEALWFFSDAFIQFINAEEHPVASNAEALINAVLTDLKMINITLEEGDDAQIIFETLNGRGAELHATDLIRNYIFMRAVSDDIDAAMLYENDWKPFEDPYWTENQRRGRIYKPRLEWLIHATLQAEKRSEVDLSRLYNEFRDFVTKDMPARRADQQVALLTRYANQYKELIGDSGTTPVARFGRRIAAYDVTTIHPLALLISVTEISDTEKTVMFNDLVSYVVRRAVCGLTPKNYNNVFMAVLRHLAKTAVSSVELRYSLKNLNGEASRWPTDSEFLNACITAQLYPGRLDTPKMRMMLTELEGELRRQVKTEEPDAPKLSNLDIDHLMPQQWFSHWPLENGQSVTDTEASAVAQIVLAGAELTPDQELVRKRQQVIATLGNLTLLNLSVNRSLQHSDFLKKRDAFLTHTSLRLNVPLTAKDRWDEEQILARGALLGNAALNMWPQAD